MRQWRTTFAYLPDATEDDRDEYDNSRPNCQLSQFLNKRTAHRSSVRKRIGGNDILWSTFDGLRQQDRCCTIRMLANELKRAAGNENASIAALLKRFKQ